MARERMSSHGVPLAPTQGSEQDSERPVREIPFRPPDNWSPGIGRSVMGECVTCMYFNNARCRRHAPRGQEGWPAVFPSDYCGDHKLPKEAIMA